MKDEIYKNMNVNGGGIAVNITGKWESNRNALARMDITKRTAGQVALSLRKKGYDYKATDIKEICEEWHHAGFYRKDGKSIMSRTFYTQKTDEQIIEELGQNLSKQQLEKQKAAARQRFLTKKGVYFSRVLQHEIPKHSVIIEEEMNGKYGWFPASSKYSLPVFYSGYYFKSNKTLQNYYKI